jgi:phosphoribosylanthranilate isomerase
MSTIIKICGLSTPESVTTCIEEGADWIGFIFFPKSPRNVSVEKAAELAAPAKGKVRRIAVTVNADDALLDKIVTVMQPDILQLHGSETVERTAEIKKRFSLPVMKAFSIGTAEDLQKIEPYKEISDFILLDAKAPTGSNLPGGNGVSFDWNLLSRLDPSMKYLLSGGLNLENIIQALDVSGARSVDISSGVESTPGVKDIAKIAAFIKTIRQRDAALAGNALAEG